MNKKIFGKAAALSIAAVTALSTFAMTASADITYGSQDTISGTAYRIDWTVVRTDVTTTADYNAVTNTVSFRNISYSQTALTDSTSIAVGSLLPGGAAGATPDEKGAGSEYVSSNVQASTMKSNITSAVAAQKSIADTDLSTWKKAWNNYVSDVNSFNNAKKALSETVTSKEYTDSNGVKQTVVADSVCPHTAPAATVSYYTYSGDPSIVTKSMKQLSDELNTKYVTITKGIIEGSLTSNGAYTINITGDSSNSGSGSSESVYNTWYPTVSSYRQPTTTNLSYQGYNGYWYTRQDAANLYGDGFNNITKPANYSALTGTDVYFSADNGLYYSTASEAGVHGAHYYLVSSAVYSSSYGSYKAADGFYYPTITAAQNASYAYNRSSAYTTYATTASARYFSMVTGKFYSSASAAQAAAPAYSSTYVIDLANYTGTTSTYYNYLDPYYYYFMMGNNGGSMTTTIDPDAPAIYGSTKKSGWNKIISTIKTTAKGKTVKVDMNASTVVPDDVLTAAKAKGVNLQFVLGNGAVWTVKAADIKSTDTLSVDVDYNTKNIKSSLVSKAKKLNPGAVSTAQISVSNDGSLGVDAALTVKLSSKRSGCTVKAYIKTSSGSLKLVDKGVVNSNGNVTLDINKGGDYLLVVID